ncbi:hypothetical protein [Nocardia brasiliensis]|uniref:hypothetical protein n=1 Tax=Nocardia brasiliensis TaxID=37326 RepID=UPI00366E347F
MGQTAGEGRQRSEDLSELIAGARRMSAARLFLEIKARGHDPIKVMNELSAETLGL